VLSDLKTNVGDEQIRATWTTDLDIYLQNMGSGQTTSIVSSTRDITDGELLGHLLAAPGGQVALVETEEKVADNESLTKRIHVSIGDIEENEN